MLEQKIYIEIVQIQLVILNEISITYHLFTKISLKHPLVWKNDAKCVEEWANDGTKTSWKLLLFILIYIVWSLHYRKKTPK